jgi:hypothetical protein
MTETEKLNALAAAAEVHSTTILRHYAGFEIRPSTHRRIERALAAHPELAARVRQAVAS